MTLTERTTRKIISLNIDIISYKGAIDRIIELGKRKASGYVCFANAHMTIEAYESGNFAAQVNNASLVLADGVPIVKSLNSLYQISQERIAGMDIFPDLIKRAESDHLNIFFFGTTDEVLGGIRTRINKEHPGVNIVGLLSPPFNKPLDDELYINSIRSSGANLVFVALGCPKQEQWMSNNSDKINAVLLGVGGAFPVYAGVTKRAPVFMQNFGLEWLYRLSQEPTRLFKRYLKTNSQFIFLISKIKIKHVIAKLMK